MGTQEQAFGLAAMRLIGMFAAHIRIPGFKSQLCPRLQLPAIMHPGRNTEISSALVPVTHMAHLVRVLILSSWFQPGPALTIVIIWELNQWMGVLCVCLSF